MLEIRNKHTYFLTITIIDNCILACNFKSCKETYLTSCHMLVGRQEETERFHVVFPPYMRRIFPKKLSMGEGVGVDKFMRGKFTLYIGVLIDMCGVSLTWGCNKEAIILIPHYVCECIEEFLLKSSILL